MPSSAADTAPRPVDRWFGRLRHPAALLVVAVLIVGLFLRGSTAELGIDEWLNAQQSGFDDFLGVAFGQVFSPLGAVLLGIAFAATVV